MRGRELIERTLEKKPVPVSGFWVGHPTDAAKEIYYKQVGIAERQLTEQELANERAAKKVNYTTRAGRQEVNFNCRIGSDMVWLSPELDLGAWCHPQGKPMWDCFNEKHVSLGTGGIFADCEDVEEIEAFDWPNPDYLDMTATLEDTRYAWEQGLAVFGGMWCPFFHVMCDFFGMENYFVKMYTDPEVIHAATRHIVDFYLETNRRYLTMAKPYLSAAFFGNDLGSQRDLLISPECFDTFILPYMREIIDQIKGMGLKVAMHSCGSIDRIIPRLIDAGVDILHPLQAKAANMDAEHLAKHYGGKITFLGGVDTQELLPFGTPQQVREEVLRLRDLFKGDFIVSPSHEALLPNVSFENMMAMSRAAKE